MSINDYYELEKLMEKSTKELHEELEDITSHIERKREEEWLNGEISIMEHLKMIEENLNVLNAIMLKISKTD